MAKKKTDNVEKVPAKAGDLGNLLKNLKLLRENIAAAKWWAAWENWQEIVQEAQLGMTDVSFTSNPSPKACCESLDACIEELENHDDKAAKAPVPAMAGGLWLSLLPMILQVVQMLMEKLSKKE